MIVALALSRVLFDRSLMLATWLVVLAAGASPAARAADEQASSGLYFEQTTRVVPQDGTVASGVRSRVWHAARRMRLEAGDEPGGPALVLRLDEGRALRLDPETKVATEIDTRALRARSHQDASVASTLIGGEDELRTTPLAGTRTIAGHACSGFRLKSRAASVELWVAADLPRAAVFADFLEWSGAAQALPGLVAAIRELPGFPLETRTRVSVLGESQETVSTVTKIRLGPQPPELFDVPAGFRLDKVDP
jgi:hypothetical protein